MDGARKKELVRAYKERKSLQGIYASRCEASNGVWVASSKNLYKQQNGLWFALGTGRHSNAKMQAAWNARGEGSFRYEILEVVNDENPLLIESLLKDRKKHWRTRLNAEPLIG